MRPAATRPWLIAACALALATPAAAQDRLLLRGGGVRTGPRVAFNEDGVTLGGEFVGWEEIRAATLAAEQDRFDQMLATLGEPLFQIRRRLEQENYAEIAEPAEAVLSRFAQRRSATAYMVFQGLMRARLASNQTELALEPYFLCLDCLRDLKKNLKQPKPAKWQMQLNTDSGLAKELIPVWFDAKSAKAAWPRVRKAIDGLEKPIPPGVYVYAATLALAAGEAVAADELLKQTPKTEAAVNDLLQVVEAQREVQAGKPGPALDALEKQIDRYRDPVKAVAYYWLGLGLIASADTQKKKAGVLQLLHVPALYRDSEELAAASLYHAVKTLETLQDLRSGAVGEELFSTYPGSQHAAKRKAEIQAGKKDATMPP